MPYSAQYVKNRNIIEFASEQTNDFLNKHYMDENADSRHTAEKSIKRMQELVFILSRGESPCVFGRAIRRFHGSGSS